MLADEPELLKEIVQDVLKQRETRPLRLGYSRDGQVMIDTDILLCHLKPAVVQLSTHKAQCVPHAAKDPNSALPRE